MAVIDSHAHIYPNKIAARAVSAISQFYNIPMENQHGTPEALLAECEGTPITHFIVHSVATTAHAVTSINNFISEQCKLHPEFIGFGTMHQDFEDPEAEIDRMIELGLHGVKLHPDTQEVDMDDPRLMAVYEIMEARGLPLVVHTGDFRHDFSHPRRLKNVLRTFPDLVVNGAHLAGCFIPDIGYDVLHAERLFVDASSTLPFVGARRFGELVRMWGVDRVMFGSDFPMWNPNCEYAVLASCGFTDDEMEKLTRRNAERFAGVTVE